LTLLSLTSFHGDGKQGTFMIVDAQAPFEILLAPIEYLILFTSWCA
jgi:hypothetical protein